jgi:hypothetical protein
MGTAIELDVNADAALRQTLEYWQRLRGPRRMPARKDLNPADIPRLLPKLMLADVGRVDAGTDFPPIRFRLVGTEVVGRFGYELTGRNLSEIDYGDQADEIAALYRRTVDDGRPHFARIPFRPGGDQFLYMQHLLLPLSDDGANVNMILTVVHCQ